MAITARLVEDKAVTTGASSYASDVPSAGSVTETHIAWVMNTHGTDATLPTLSGGGLTWTQIDTAHFSTNRRCTAFRARGTNTAAAITADFGGTTQTGCIIIWLAFDGVDGTTDNGVVQSAVDGSTGTSGAASLAAIGANNAVASGACSNIGGDFTPESPFTELSDVEYATPTTSGHAMWAVTTDTTPTHTAPSSSSWRIVAVELKAVSAGQTIGQVTETDTAQAIAWAPKIRALGQVSEADTAQALSRLKTLDIGQALETDTAQPIAAPVFPSVTARNDSQEAVATTSHVVDLPAAIAVGDLLIVAISLFGSGSGTLTWPAGWTLIAGIGGAARSEARYRIADGTEGSTVTLTTSLSKSSAHRSWRVTGHHASTVPEGVAASLTSANPDPPVLDPASWGTENTLWLVVTGGEDNGVTVSGFPTNYGDTFAQSTGSGALDVFQATAERRLNAASEDPDVFTLSASRQVRTLTIAIRPVAPSGVIAFGQTVETDTASTLGHVKTQDIAAAVETDTVSPLARKKSVTLGQVSEADTAQPVTWAPKIRLLGQVLETDTAQVITSPGAIGQVVETDTAQAFTHRKTRLLGQALETDTSQAVGKRKVKATGQVSEADTAQALIAILRETWRTIRPQAGGTLTPPTTGTITPPVTQTITRP